MGNIVQQTKVLAAIWLAIIMLPALTIKAVPPDYKRDIRQPQLPVAASPNDPTAGGSNSPILSNDGDLIFCGIDKFDFDSFGGSDCWGWEGPDGTEYAIMGVSTGVAFVNVTAGQVVQIVPGPTSGCGNILWRDMVTYGHYCYVVSECLGTNDGMMIIDMQGLPNSVSFVRSYRGGAVVRVH